MRVWCVLLLLSCGGKGDSVDTDEPTETDTDTDTDADTDTDTGGPVGTLPLGTDCVDDIDCVTGVCWDFNDYDPYCGGAVCSALCVTDQDCINAFTAGGAPYPMSVTCGGDGRCDPLASGFGAFFCAR